MLKAILDAVMERRARQLMEQVGAWLPTEGRLPEVWMGLPCRVISAIF